ncbi:hypothetical protein [Compostimonas suwonensis]|uniref:Tetratricopeptide repeat protein n=1 Tax=Compostimonas suwonensis TaxID=1048394 RepID=A0A2M9C5D7_9MICO|nr:hypothetical protein [Compostimonas suwonensis]PJJ65687.1 hypothetical protein CLV54_0724 [Compostimonas suwonensis]
MSIVLGVDPVTLHPRVDLFAAGQRLQELGQLRSLSGIVERAELLVLVGRPDEAWDAANEAVRLARFTGDRKQALEARILRGRVRYALVQMDDAVIELSGCVDEANGHDWTELELEATSARALVHFDRGDDELALSDFTATVFLRQKLGVGADELAGSLHAVAVVEARLAEARNTL